MIIQKTLFIFLLSGIAIGLHASEPALVDPASLPAKIAKKQAEAREKVIFANGQFYSIKSTVGSDIKTRRSVLDNSIKAWTQNGTAQPTAAYTTMAKNFSNLDQAQKQAILDWVATFEFKTGYTTADSVPMNEFKNYATDPELLNAIYDAVSASTFGVASAYSTTNKNLPEDLVNKIADHINTDNTNAMSVLADPRLNSETLSYWEDIVKNSTDIPWTQTAYIFLSSNPNISADTRETIYAKALSGELTNPMGRLALTQAETEELLDLNNSALQYLGSNPSVNIDTILAAAPSKGANAINLQGGVLTNPSATAAQQDAAMQAINATASHSISYDRNYLLNTPESELQNRLDAPLAAKPAPTAPTITRQYYAAKISGAASNPNLTPAQITTILAELNDPNFLYSTNVTLNNTQKTSAKTTIKRNLALKDPANALLAP